MASIASRYGDMMATRLSKERLSTVKTRSLWTSTRARLLRTTPSSAKKHTTLERGVRAVSATCTASATHTQQSPARRGFSSGPSSWNESKSLHLAGGIWKREDGAQRGFRQVQCRGLKTGIVGLPNVGKSTLFNALVEGSQAQAANFPFCTIEPNVGTVPVPDQRLEELTTLSKSKSKIATTIEFVDIAGLVSGASKGEGLGNKFLSHIREVDAIVHVVRCFEDDNVVHVDGSVDPLRDSEVIETELALADMAQIERRLVSMKKKGKNAPDKATLEAEKKVLDEIYAKVEQGLPARKADLADEDFDLVKDLCLLTMKPVIFAANVTVRKSKLSSLRRFLSFSTATTALLGFFVPFVQTLKQALCDVLLILDFCVCLTNDITSFT
jgi:GTPase SAR1 family protein